MAPKREPANPPADPDGIFRGVSAFFVPHGVQSRRLEVWKQKLVQMGGRVQEHKAAKGATFNHVLAADAKALLRELDAAWLHRFRGSTVSFDWLEECLKAGKRLPEHKFTINYEEEFKPKKAAGAGDAGVSNPAKRSKMASENNKEINGQDGKKEIATGEHRDTIVPEGSGVKKGPNQIACSQSSSGDTKDTIGSQATFDAEINEIVTTGKLSKLEHFENDEKVRAVNLFGEVWGVGPATALKLYDKGYCTLDDLQKDDSLTYAQRTGLKFFDDIKQRIPRHEVSEMEKLLQEVGKDILPGVIIICGGSYRRGKASCGDMDIVITHPDGESHVGFLPKFVQRLKDMSFLREDLIFSIHSIEGTDCGVDTYFGLCTYPGRELRHRIDLKVYPRNRYAFGLLAWTGNDVLNRRLRILAESKGYVLDDTGLYLATQSSGGKRVGRSEAIVNCHEEKDVFDTLGFPWLEPHERNL
ncbi:hypothetical protein ACQ4PT_071178 [Festuca glaucescens]